VTAGCFDPSPNGASDGFVSRLNPAGTALAWSTYLGGAQDDEVQACSLFPDGSVALSGSTASSATAFDGRQPTAVRIAARSCYAPMSS
jgi:hypothetical protein